MRFFAKCKDGGPESTVTAFVLFEIKAVASIMVLRFGQGSRDAYHSHAFNAVSWLLAGNLNEKTRISGSRHIFNWTRYFPSLRPIWTPRARMHKVFSKGTSWVLTFRGPWAKEWTEVLPSGRIVTLRNGRVEV